MGRAPVVAAITAAFYVIVLFTVKTVPDWTVAMLGGPKRPIERLGGLTAWWRPPAGGEAAYQRYIAERGGHAHREGELAVLEFPGLPEASVKDTIDMLAFGGLVFKEVISGTPYAQEIGTRGGAVMEPREPIGPDEVAFEVDQWRPEDGGGVQTDYYLQSQSPDALARMIDKAFADGYALPDGTELAYEWVEPPTPNKRAFIRTYLVSTTVEIDGGDIDQAVASFDPNTYRPTVLLDFTREGGRKFGDLTARIVGKKLATIVGNRVMSAPIINGAIRGGRASVWMGGSDAERQQREADALVGVLRMGALPPGGVVERHEWKPAANARMTEWLARLLFGLVAGLVTGGLAFLLLRLTRPTMRSRMARITGGNKRMRRILVTALAPVTLYLGAKLTLPWINEEELVHVAARSGGSVGEQFSVIAIGLTPIIFAYAVVELAALLVPAWRWRRFDPLGRAGLGRAVAILSLIVAAIQAYFVWSYLDSLGARGLSGFGGMFGNYGIEILDRGAHVKWLVIVTLVAGTCLLAFVAGVITEHGLGNGYAALLASGFVLDIVQPYLFDGITGLPFYLVDDWHRLLLGIAGTIAIALATRALLRRKIGEIALPSSGIAPIGDAAAVIALLLMLWSLVAKDPFEAQALMMRFYSNPWLHTAVVLASIPLWAWLFARPSIFAIFPKRTGIAAPTTRTWLRAMGFSLVAMAAIYAVGQTFAGHTSRAFVPLSIMIATAALLDIADDMRARRRNLVIVGVVHHAQHATVLEHLLADAEIPAHFQARNIRTLFSFFAPWAPIVVYAPEDKKEAAVAKYEQWRSDLTVFD